MKIMPKSMHERRVSELPRHQADRPSHGSHPDAKNTAASRPPSSQQVLKSPRSPRSQHTATGAACDGNAAAEAWNGASCRMLASSEPNLGGGSLEAPTIFKPKLTSYAFAQDIDDAFPQAADMSLPVAQAAVRAVGASTGAG